MTSTHPHIPVLELSGTPGQVGAAHGEAQRERIREYVDVFLGWLLKTSAVALTMDSLWARWSPQVVFNQREAPALIEEMQGIARGAGVPFERIFLLNSMLDLNSFRYYELAETFYGGCSTFAVAAEAGTGKTLIGQTYDLAELHEKYVTILKIKPAQGPRQLVFSFAGIVGSAGLNDAGLAVNINYLSPRDVGLGRLHCVVVRQILGSTNFADALTHPTVAPRAGGAHYLIADRDGNIVSIETTGKRFSVFYPQGNAIGHTNHYLADYLRDVEYIRSTSIGSSIARYTALRRFFQDRGNEITVDTLKSLTQNHTSYPRSICSHPTATEQPGAAGRTVSAMVQVIADGTLHITRGCACENPYHPVSL